MTVRLAAVIILTLLVLAAGCKAAPEPIAEPEERTVTSSALTESESGTDHNAVASQAEEEQAGPGPGDKVINLCERVVDLTAIHDIGPTYSDRLWHRYIRWSPDSSRILFNNPVLEGGSLYSVELEDSSLRTLAKAPAYVAEDSLQVPDGGRIGFVDSMMYFDISPDSSRIVYSTCAYTREEPGQELSNNWSRYGRYYQVVPDIDDAGSTEQEQEASSWVYNYEIVASDIDGANLKRLTNNTAFDNFPAWSPDGSKIAFMTDSVLSDFAIEQVTIYTVAQDRSDAITLTPNNDSVVIMHPPEWSPDGERLAVVGIVSANGPRRLQRVVYTVGSDGSGLTWISDAASGPAWSPDGQRIALSVPVGEAMGRPRSTTDGIYHLGVSDVALYTFAADGSDAVLVADSDGLPAPKVTPEDPWMWGLSWSPDGSEILLKGFGHRVPLDGSSPVGGGPSNYFMDAEWSPDGSKIAILVGVSPYGRDSAPWKTGVYVMDRDGTNIRTLW